MAGNYDPNANPENHPFTEANPYGGSTYLDPRIREAAEEARRRDLIAAEKDGKLKDNVTGFLGMDRDQAQSGNINFGNVADNLAGRLLGTGDIASNVELGDLQKRTQVLEGVIGYEHSYSNGGISFTPGFQKYSMDRQIGPSVGVGLQNGGFTLGSRGLWVADAHCSFDFISFGVALIELECRVFDPNGNLHFIRTTSADIAQRLTLSVHMPFTIPTANYRLEMHLNAAIGRGVIGGSRFNGLSVEKKSSETN